MGEFGVELWMLVRERKKSWLLSIVIMLAVFGRLGILAQGAPVAPFIDTLY